MLPQELYHHVAQLLESMPAYVDLQPITPQHQTWQARALAALDHDGIRSVHDTVNFRIAIDRAAHGFMSASGEKMAQALSNLLARCEISLPAETRGAFLSVGNDYSAFATISGVLGEARTDILIVDPYIDHVAIQRFVTAAPDGVSIRLLRETTHTRYEAGLRESQRTWNIQYPSRPMEIRSAAERSLHDRAIFIDRASAFSVTQSLKDLAARSPAMVQRTVPELTAEKIAAYENLWRAAQPL